MDGPPPCIDNAVYIHGGRTQLNFLIKDYFYASHDVVSTTCCNFSSLGPSIFTIQIVQLSLNDRYLLQTFHFGLFDIGCPRESFWSSNPVARSCSAIFSGLVEILIFDNISKIYRLSNFYMVEYCEIFKMAFTKILDIL